MTITYLPIVTCSLNQTFSHSRLLHSVKLSHSVYPAEFLCIVIYTFDCISQHCDYSYNQINRNLISTFHSLPYKHLVCVRVRARVSGGRAGRLVTGRFAGSIPVSS